MTITIRKFTAKDNRDWDEFVSSSNNGTIFHTRKFLGYHPADRFVDNSLIFNKKGKTIALLPAVKVRDNKEETLISHPGASVGSVVFRENLSFADSLSITKELLNYADRQNIASIQLTLPPIIYYRKPSHYLEFSLRQHGFTIKKRELSSILFLENSIEKNLQKFKPSHRTALRKGLKAGITVQQSDDIHSFYKILEKTFPFVTMLNPPIPFRN